MHQSEEKGVAGKMGKYYCEKYSGVINVNYVLVYNYVFFVYFV